MLQRVRQFYRAVFASIDEKDRAFISRYLDEKGQKLFFSMQIYDQRHVLNVAYTAQALVQDLMKDCLIINIDKNLLIKSCLLHDIGRNAEDFCLLDKVINVLMAYFLPNLSRMLAQKASLYKNAKRNFFKRRQYALYIYYNHAQIGAEILMDNNMKEIAELVRYHHDLPKENEREELKILRRADELN